MMVKRILFTVFLIVLVDIHKEPTSGLQWLLNSRHSVEKVTWKIAPEEPRRSTVEECIAKISKKKKPKPPNKTYNPFSEGKFLIKRASYSSLDTNFTNNS